MNSSSLLPGNALPRQQASRLVERIAPEGAAFRGVLLGHRGEGKTDLLRQAHALLFHRAEGPIPFWYAFQRGQEEAAGARHFAASFCQQVRAFLMRREELLWEPVANLGRELERPGLPLSLTELAQSILALPEGDLLEFVAALPAQFAHRERRPLGLLLDDAEALDSRSPFWAALGSPDLSWLLSGRYPLLLRLAGEAAWPLIPLEPFSSQEALLLAEKMCREAGVNFSKAVWDLWVEVAGTSSWLVNSLITSASGHNESLESAEELGRAYIQELSRGTLGNWLAARWQKAVPDRRDRARVAEFLVSLAKAGQPTPTVSSLSAELWDGLVAEEWAQETALGPQVLLGRIQEDWLTLTTAVLGGFSQRAESRALQTFLLRIEQSRQREHVAGVLTAIREKLRKLPHSGFPEGWAWERLESHPPRVTSVSWERVGTAELFWVYGFQGGEAERLEVACLFLIVLCEEAPSAGQGAVWRRQWEEEARCLPVAGPSLEGFRPRGEVWVVVPPGASLASEAFERRFSWETLSRFLEFGGPSEKLPSSLEPI